MWNLYESNPYAKMHKCHCAATILWRSRHNRVRYQKRPCPISCMVIKEKAKIDSNTSNKDGNTLPFAVAGQVRALSPSRLLSKRTTPSIRWRRHSAKLSGVCDSDSRFIRFIGHRKSLSSLNEALFRPYDCVLAGGPCAIRQRLYSSTFVFLTACAVTTAN